MLALTLKRQSVLVRFRKLCGKIGWSDWMIWGICPSGPPTFYTVPLKIHQDTYMQHNHWIRSASPCILLIKVRSDQKKAPLHLGERPPSVEGLRWCRLHPLTWLAIFFPPFLCSFSHCEKTQKEQMERPNKLLSHNCCRRSNADPLSNLTPICNCCTIQL